MARGQAADPIRHTRRIRKTVAKSGIGADRVWAFGLKDLVGLKLVDFDVNHKDGPSGGADVVLIFEGGKEILIYIHEDGSLFVEG